MVDPVSFAEIKAVYPGAAEMNEGGITFIFLPNLILPPRCVPRSVDGLLSLSQHGGYTTRLFLSQPVHGAGNNWTVHSIFGKTWHTWSWNNVPSGLRPVEILAEHLRGLH
jgi:hypothetical protein